MLIERKAYQPATDGEHAATLADIVDLGEQTSQFGTKHRCKLVFIIDEEDEDDEPIRVNAFCTVTTHKSSRLSEFVKAMTGKLPGKQFETDSLIGLALTLTTEQTKKEGDVYSNVVHIAPLRKGMKAPAVPLNFERANASNKNQGRVSKSNGSGIRKKTTHNLHGVDVSDADVFLPMDTE